MPDFQAMPREADIHELRAPPQSIEAEQALLGGLLLRSEAWNNIADKVSTSDFYRHDHRVLYDAITELVNENQPCDAITIGDWVKRHEKEDVVSVGYVLELAATTPSAANIEAYAQIVREKSVLRQLADAGTDIASSAYQPQGNDSGDLLDMAEQKIFAISEAASRGKQGFVSVLESTRQAFQDVTFRAQNQGKMLGVPSGFADLDKQTTGFQPGDLVILAARPSMGKTALALNIGEYAALTGDKVVAVFSMEMTAAQLTMRLFSSLGRVDSQRLRTGMLDDQDWNQISGAVRQLSNAKLHIDDTPALSPNELRSRTRRLAAEHGGVGLIIVDYLQLMQIPGTSENRTTEVSAISRGMKALAKEMNAPVIALSQLNRSLESRTDKRPMMSDLRESGAIEQDADVIMFIYRDEYYTKEECKVPGTAEVIIAKQRNGPTGKVTLAFRGQYSRFENYTAETPFEGTM